MLTRFQIGKTGVQGMGDLLRRLRRDARGSEFQREWNTFHLPTNLCHCGSIARSKSEIGTGAFRPIHKKGYGSKLQEPLRLRREIGRFQRIHQENGLTCNVQTLTTGDQQAQAQ